MLNTIKTAALSALVGLGTLAAIPATAQADGLYLNLGQGGPGVGIYVQDRYDNGRHAPWGSRQTMAAGTVAARPTAPSTRPSAWASAAPVSST